jgi:hypothetical protein
MASNEFTFNNNQPKEFKFIHYAPSDDNFYLIICRNIQGSIPDHDSDHIFFYQGPTEIYYVTCKLLSRSLILNILNEGLYGIKVDGGPKNLISLNQQFNLERDLKILLELRLSYNGFPPCHLFANQDYNESNNYPAYPRQVERYNISANGRKDEMIMQATDINQNYGDDSFSSLE